MLILKSLDPVRNTDPDAESKRMRIQIMQIVQTTLQ